MRFSRVDNFEMESTTLPREGHFNFRLNSLARPPIEKGGEFLYDHFPNHDGD
jgi:hypothetical protein